MEALLIKVLNRLALMLLTENVIIGLALHGLAAIAKKTENKTDDKMLAEIAEALGRFDIAAQLRADPEAVMRREETGE